MLNAFKAWKMAYKVILRDRQSFVLALIPILIGLILYVFLGNLYFSAMLEYGHKFIAENISSDTFGQIIHYLFIVILTLLLYFLVNWTFVLILSVIASPFNDLLSQRVERVYLGKALPSLGESFAHIRQKIVKTIANELKKLMAIVFISGLGLLFSFIPLLAPISLLITFILLAVGYLDYSWSRHDLSFSDCRSDIKKNSFSYALAGSFFMIMISIPVFNIIVPALGTSYFTILWMMNNEYRCKITQ